MTTFTLFCSIVLFIIAAISNAIMDTLTHHFSTSIFKNKKAIWWDPSISWKNKYVDGDPNKPQRTIPVAFTDAWHLFKSIMIVCLCGVISCVGYYCNDYMTTVQLPWYVFVIIFVISGIMWNTIFSIFYNKILRK